MPGAQVPGYWRWENDWHEGCIVALRQQQGESPAHRRAFSGKTRQLNNPLQDSLNSPLKIPWRHDFGHPPGVHPYPGRKMPKLTCPLIPQNLPLLSHIYLTAEEKKISSKGGGVGDGLYGDNPAKVCPGDTGGGPGQNRDGRGFTGVHSGVHAGHSLGVACAPTLPCRSRPRSIVRTDYCQRG